MKTSVPTARALRRNPHGDGCVSHLTGRGFAGSITARVSKALSPTKQIQLHEGDETRYRFIPPPVVRVIAREHYRALLVFRQEEPADQWVVVGSDGREGEALQWLHGGPSTARWRPWVCHFLARRRWSKRSHRANRFPFSTPVDNDRPRQPLHAHVTPQIFRHQTCAATRLRPAC